MDRLSIHDSPAGPAAQQQQQQSPQPQAQPPPHAPQGPQAQQAQQQAHSQQAQGQQGQGQNLGPSAMQGPPQLPPQMFTTAAQLLDLTDSTYSITHWLPNGLLELELDLLEDESVVVWRETNWH